MTEQERLEREDDELLQGVDWNDLDWMPVPPARYSKGKKLYLRKGDPSGIDYLQFSRRYMAISLYNDCGREMYTIDLDRMETPQGLLSWLFHLETKNWGTRELLGAILELVALVVEELTRADPKSFGQTAEHCYCYRHADSNGKEKDGFRWTELSKRKANRKF